MNSRKKWFVFASVLCLFLWVDVSFAQQTPPPPTLPTADQAPIDGGLGLLLAGGSAYALKKLRKK